MVTKGHIEKIVGRLDSEGRFGADNRAGLPGQLHRISVMRSKQVTSRLQQDRPRARAARIHGLASVRRRRASCRLRISGGGVKIGLLRGTVLIYKEEQRVLGCTAIWGST